MKIILISIVLLFSTLANAQSLKNRFVRAYETIEIDPNFDNAKFKYFGFIYKDVDDVITKRLYYEIYVYLGDEMVRFCFDITKRDNEHYMFPPNLREEYLDMLIKHPVDSVEYWKVNRPTPSENKLLHTLIPDDPNYFIEYYERIIK